jgi:tRNA 2-thiocytidine biosynthesis protein TtcA
MPYATPLEAKIAKKVTKAITDYNLIEDGDRVMVGLSGGKDSWALLQILDVLRQRAPITFTLTAVTVDSGYDGYRHDLISKTCEARGWEYRIIHTEIGETIEELLEANATPCSLCARFRRGVLYRLATEVGATKIALGHHLDDFIETLLLNLFFAGALKAMPARLVSDKGATVRQGVRAADHRMLLPGLWRSRLAAPARETPDRRARGRASRREEFDDSSVGQRALAAPARSSVASAA